MWIFFDIGSTLVDEIVAYDVYAKRLIENSSVSFHSFDKKRREFQKNGYDGNSKTRDFFNLEKKEWPSEEEVVFPDAIETLSYLKKKGYKLGIIANQPKGTEERLKNYGLSDFFSLVFSSFEVGLSKPDLRLFKLALREARSVGDNSFMVGDRLDNDIYPAKEVGMRTIWIRKGLTAMTPLSFANGKADYIISDLKDLKKIL